jgi:hypothetical protein
MAQVTKDVVRETHGKQRPWQSSSLDDDFYFLPPKATPTESASNVDALFWESVKASSDPAEFKAYLAKFPHGMFSELAQSRFLKLTNEAHRFDGSWTVTEVCDRAPDGANGYTLNYSVKVADGFLDGGYGLTRSTDVLRLHGGIGADGTADLEVGGLTGAPENSIGRIPPGSPYHYDVTGKFTRSTGTGSRIQDRKCAFTFTKLD